MQSCGSQLLTVIQSGQRDLPELDLFELYEPDENNLFPENAVKRWASTEILWYGWKYERQAIGRSDISRYMGSDTNKTTVTLSNVDRTVSTWLADNDIEGYRLVVRMISRRVANDSIVLFVGRCEKTYETDNKTVQIAAKQDLGSIDNELPFNIFQPKCPLGFKGIECLAGELLTSKSAAYQAATTCNKSFGQCTTYLNTDAFQGIRFNAVKGKFRVSERRGGAGGAIAGLVGLGNHKVTKNYSSQDDSPYGKSVPLGLGRTQIEFVPIVHADTGEFLAGEWIIGEGEVAGILNVHNVSPGWSDSFEYLDIHYGKYGTDTSQDQTGFFRTPDKKSHKAYIEATIRGDNPDTGDPAPGIAGLILWIKIPIYTDTGFDGLDWSDNPVEQWRFLLTEPRGLNYSAAWIDEVVAADTLAYCNEPLIDTTGGEELYVSLSAGIPGTDYKRYRSTGLLDTEYYRWKLGISSYAYPSEREAGYHTYDPASPPDNPPASTFYRRRFTSNFHIKDKVKTGDFLYKSFLAAFRGYQITGSDGRLQLKAERPALSSLLRGAVSAGASIVQVGDVVAWKALTVPVVYALIGSGTATSETRVISSSAFSTAGNSITLTTSVSGTVTATASGATLSGGTSVKQPEGKVTIGGTPAEGDSVTITIDGVATVLAANGGDTTGTLAGQLAMRINATGTLNTYIEARWTVDLPNVVRIFSKLGNLILSQSLTSGHALGDPVVQVAMPFSDVAFGALTRGNIVEDSFKWPLGSKQSSYNRFILIYNDAIQDFQELPIEENDEEHQDKINKINKLEIAGGCIDNYHQANRICQAARYKYRDGNYFNSLTSSGLALLLEEGDIICTNHSAQPNRRNQLFRIEELKITPDHKVHITARLYTDSQYPDATATTIPLTSGLQPGGPDLIDDYTGDTIVDDYTGEQIRDDNP